jgi:hypothetical protein
MKTTRRGVLAATGMTLLAGCNAFIRETNSINWSTGFDGEFITRRPHVDADRVAVATPHGNLCLLATDTGDPVGEGCGRALRYHVAGTPPVRVGERYLTVTDEVIVADRTGEIAWSEPLPGENAAKTGLRPFVVEETAYVFTRSLELLRIDVEAREITRVGDLVLDAGSGDVRGSRAVVGTGGWRTAIVDLATGAKEWESDANMSPDPCWYGSDVVTQGYSDDEIHVRRISPDDWSERWATSVPGTDVLFTGFVDESTLAMVTTFPDSVDSPDRVSILDGGTGVVRDSHDLEFASWGWRGGAIHGDRLYLTGNRDYDQGVVVAVTPGDGKRTVVELDRSISSPPAVRDNAILFGTKGATVYSVAMD